MRIRNRLYEYLREVPQTPDAFARRAQEGPRSDSEADELTAFIYEKARKIREARGHLTAEQVKQIDGEQDG